MVNIYELRKGNCIEVEHFNRIIRTFVDNVVIRETPYINAAINNGEYVESFWKDKITPIPITGEFLRKNGFFVTFIGAYMDSTVEIFSRDSFELDYFPENPDVFITNSINGIKVGIKYVHQLQNMYFAKTGKELEIEW